MYKKKSKSSTVSTLSLCKNVTDRFENVIPRKLAKEIISDLLRTIGEYVLSGHKVRIDRLGVLYFKEAAPRVGRNPKTGLSIKIPARKKIIFKASTSLKEIVSSQKKLFVSKKESDKYIKIKKKR